MGWGPASCVPELDYGEVHPSRLARVLFLSTNLPFFACAIALAARGHAVLGVCTALMGFVSGGFHFYQVRDGGGSNRVRLWLMCDFAMAGVLVVANLCAATALPSAAVWALAVAGVALLYFGTLRRHAVPRAWRVSVYTATHGAWHLLICAASSLFVVQSHAAPAADDTPASRAALSVACLLSASGTALFVLRGCPCGPCGAPGGGHVQAKTAAASAKAGSSAGLRRPRRSSRLQAQKQKHA